MRSIQWKLNLSSSKESVYQFLTTDRGRQSFWVESSLEKDGLIHFVFPDGQEIHSRVVSQSKNHEFALEYFGSRVEFILTDNLNRGTTLVLHTEVSETEYDEIYAGWVSVLMNLKAVADFDCDLRNHHPDMTWEDGFCNN